MKTMNSIKLLALVLAMSAASFVQASEINVQILSATVKDQKIADATLTLQKNGEQSVTATTNAQGQALLNATFTDSADALLIVKKTSYSNLIVKCPYADITYAISSVMTNLDGMRIVLN